MGSDLVTNGGFDSNTNNWTTANSASIASVASGQSGNCLEITENGDHNPLAYQDITTEIGKLYEVTLYVKQGTESTWQASVGETDSSNRQ